MVYRPGGTLASRPLFFFWLADCSASMALDGKIQALNNAVRETLPHMRSVAETNINAAVLVQTLRFSNSVQWQEPRPTALRDFQWRDLVADDLPKTAAFAAEFHRRLDREGAKTGDVQVSLIWNNYNDLDLHVICPCGEEIYFAHRKSQCGGELDVDMNVSPTSMEPVENVFWPPNGAPQGSYKVLVHPYKNHKKPGCSDPTPYRVAISVGGVVQEFSGRVTHGQPAQLVHEFVVDHQLPNTMAASSSHSGGNTNLGMALHLLSEHLKIPPMPSHALPPVVVLISDGQPTDDFEAGLAALMAQPWGKKTVRIAIGIGQDADYGVLQKFIGHTELRPLRADNPETLVHYIRWASTVVLQAASAPRSQVHGTGSPNTNVPIPRLLHSNNQASHEVNSW